MNEITGGSGDGSEDGKAQSLRPKWVGWLVGGSVATLVVVGGSVAVAAFSDVTQGSNDYLIHFETDPVKISKFSAENEAYEREWERQYGREYSSNNTERQGAEVGVYENLNPPLEPTRLPEDDCTPIREMTDETASAAPTLTRGDSGEVTAAPLVGPAEMDCD